MYLVAIGWVYVVVLMAVAEATSSTGTLLGAFFTALLYGVIPLSIVLYLMNTPRRRAAARAREALAAHPIADHSGPDPDGGAHPAGDTVAPVRKES